TTASTPWSASPSATATTAPEGPERSSGAPTPGPALAPGSAEDPFEIDLAVDLPIVALTGSIFLGTELIKRNFPWEGCAACDPMRVGPIDRRVLDNWSPGAATASDVLLYTAIGAPLVADLGDVLSHKTGLRGWGKDALVLVEVFAVTGAVTNTVKYAVGRPRPYSYGLDGSGRDPTEPDARLSFFSGHASITFAMASAYGSIFQARHPRSKWRAPVWVLGYGVATTTAVLRVAAGKHFWSDVLVGAIAGTSIGLLLPLAHRLHRPRRQRRGGGDLSVGVAPTLGGSIAALRGAF
ncbi:MAG: phosphatase PAP2 family protein, partial [Nannocystaceae bacterium]